MSKIGKNPIKIPENIKLEISEKSVSVNGPKGVSSVATHNGIKVELVENTAVITAKNQEDKKIRALFGMFRANLANAVKGVDVGFEKKLEMKGVGYRAQMQGSDLVLSVGYAHPVKIAPVEGVALAVADNVISVTGVDKVLVGEMAARIRKVRKPEPYKGKGIMYKGERIRRKAGKAAKAAGAK
jgi:large subunit ribosomal protein L6